MEGKGDLLFSKSIPDNIELGTTTLDTDKLTVSFENGVVAGNANGTLNEGTTFVVTDIQDKTGTHPRPRDNQN
jgi:hypothetical protein